MAIDTVKLNQGWNQFMGAIRTPNAGVAAPEPAPVNVHLGLGESVQVNVPAHGQPEIIRTPQFDAPPAGNAAVGTGFSPEPALAAELPATDLRAAIQDAATSVESAAPEAVATAPKRSRLWGDPNGANPLAMFTRGDQAVAPAAGGEAAVAGDVAAATTPRSSRLWGNPESANPFAAFGIGRPAAQVAEQAEQVAAQVEPKLSMLDRIAEQFHVPSLAGAAEAAPQAAAEVVEAAAKEASPLKQAIAGARGASMGEIANLLNLGKGAPELPGAVAQVYERIGASAAGEGAGLIERALGLAGKVAPKI